MTTFGWIYVGVSVVIAVWLYFDAEEHSMDGITWAVLGFFLNILAVIIYLAFYRGYVGRAREHKAIHGDGDILHWKQFGTDRPGTRASQTGSAPGVLDGDRDFIDDEVEALIEQGQFAKAREYVNDMIKMAKEMNDSQGVKNYKLYLTAIAEAVTRTGPSNR